MSGSLSFQTTYPFPSAAPAAPSTPPRGGGNRAPPSGWTRFVETAVEKREAKAGTTAVEVAALYVEGDEDSLKKLHALALTRALGVAYYDEVADNAKVLPYVVADVSAMLLGGGAVGLGLKHDFLVGEQKKGRGPETTKIRPVDMWGATKVESTRTKKAPADDAGKGSFYAIPWAAVHLDEDEDVGADIASITAAAPELIHSFTTWMKESRDASGVDGGQTGRSAHSRFMPASKDVKSLLMESKAAMPAESDRAASPPPFTQASPDSIGSKQGGSELEQQLLLHLMRQINTQGGKETTKATAGRGEQDFEGTHYNAAANGDEKSLKTLAILSQGPEAPDGAISSSTLDDEEMRNRMLGGTRYQRDSTMFRKAPISHSQAALAAQRYLIEGYRELQARTLQDINDVHEGREARHTRFDSGSGRRMWVGSTMFSFGETSVTPNIHLISLIKKPIVLWTPDDLRLDRFGGGKSVAFQAFVRDAHLADAEETRANYNGDKHQKAVEAAKDPIKKISDVTELTHCMEHLIIALWALWGPMNLAVQHMLECREEVIEHLMDVNDGIKRDGRALQRLEQGITLLARQILEEAQKGVMLIPRDEAHIFVFKKLVKDIVGGGRDAAEFTETGKGATIDPSAFNIYGSGRKTAFVHSETWKPSVLGNLNYLNPPYFPQLGKLFPPVYVGSETQPKTVCMAYVFSCCKNPVEGGGCTTGGQGFKKHHDFSPDEKARVTKRFEANPFVTKV